ncbi:hypothetical protein Ancab_014533 [Ancistrocladus abbreviatus]
MNTDPAYLLSDGRLERAGRVKKLSHQVSKTISADNGLTRGGITSKLHANSLINWCWGMKFCLALLRISWGPHCARSFILLIDSVAEGVELQKSKNDMVKVFIYGGVGPLHSDVTLGGVAKALGVRLAPDEEFEEYLRHIVGRHCTGDRNEMAQLPEGITELLHHENLSVPLMKCQNVIIFTATNLSELDKEWNCLLELARSSGLLKLAMPFISKSLTTTLAEIEAAQPLSALRVNFPDLYIGCYRKSRTGPLVITFEGKDKARILSAAEALMKKFEPGVFSEVN